MGREEALKLLTGMQELYVAKGKKVVHIDLRNDSPGDTELAKLLLGPTGNLRAPTVRQGKRVFVGFEESMYDQLR